MSEFGSNDYYQILGLESSASIDEIRRAYRILARRYHPDVNPGTSAKKFHLISEAYKVLSNSESRSKYDAEYEALQRMNIHKGYRAYTDEARKAFKAQSRHMQAEAEKRWRERQEAKKTEARAEKEWQSEDLKESFKTFAGKFRDFVQERVQKKDKGKKDELDMPSGKRVDQVSVIEVSLNIQEAIRGAKKSIEILDKTETRKISISIPPGSKHGDVLRMRNRHKSSEEMVLILRVAKHPLMSLENKGLVIEVPVSVQEAMYGAQIKVPALEDELMIRVPSGSQSGTEIRVPNRGVKNKDGRPGDLFYRLLVRVPGAVQAVGLKEKTEAIEQYYEQSVRAGLPQRLLSNG